MPLDCRLAMTELPPSGFMVKFGLLKATLGEDIPKRHDFLLGYQRRIGYVVHFGQKLWVIDFLPN